MREVALEELEAGTEMLAARLRAMRFARLVREALIAEVELTPKPGLVDRRGGGAHHDLSLDVMRLSALSLEPYFEEMAELCIEERPSRRLREQLAVIGRRAERAMLAATGGSNTHRGAIWILGLLVSATAMQPEGLLTIGQITRGAQEIARFEDRAAPRLLSHGGLVAFRYGFKGARGEAAAGFPSLVETGLPMLRKRRAEGLGESTARLDTLLSIMSTLDDTCVLYRGGVDALSMVKDGAKAVLDAGGTGLRAGWIELELLERVMLELGVSPGGSADLLAATLFLDALERMSDHVASDRSEREGMNGAA